MDNPNETESDRALAAYLSHNHRLDMKRVPEDWEGMAFWQVTSGRGMSIALAPSREECEEGMVAYLGTGTTITRLDGPHPFPAGNMQYVDCGLVLYGDPCESALRAPDSTPALDREMAFIDTMMCHPGDIQGTHYVSDQIAWGRMVRAWERMHERRLRHLRWALDPSDELPSLKWVNGAWD